MSRLFLADVHEVARAVYDLAGDDETRYSDAARKVLEDVTISADIRHELAVKGLAAEAASMAARLRRGVPPNGSKPKVVDVSVGVAGERAEPTHLTVHVTVEAARTYLSETQRMNRFGTQRRYIDFEPADFESSRDDERAQRIGHAIAEKQFESIRKLMIDTGAAVLGDLPDDMLVEVYMTLRAD